MASSPPNAPEDPSGLTERYFSAAHNKWWERSQSFPPGSVELAYRHHLGKQASAVLDLLQQNGIEMDDNGTLTYPPEFYMPSQAKAKHGMKKKDSVLNFEDDGVYEDDDEEVDEDDEDAWLFDVRQTNRKARANDRQPLPSLRATPAPPRRGLTFSGPRVSSGGTVSKSRGLRSGTPSPPPASRTPPPPPYLRPRPYPGYDEGVDDASALDEDELALDDSGIGLGLSDFDRILRFSHGRNRATARGVSRPGFGTARSAGTVQRSNAVRDPRTTSRRLVSGTTPPARRSTSPFSFVQHRRRSPSPDPEPVHPSLLRRRNAIRQPSTHLPSTTEPSGFGGVPDPTRRPATRLPSSRNPQAGTQGVAGVSGVGRSNAFIDNQDLYTLSGRRTRNARLSARGGVQRTIPAFSGTQSNSTVRAWWLPPTETYNDPLPASIRPANPTPNRASRGNTTAPLRGSPLRQSQSQGVSPTSRGSPLRRQRGNRGYANLNTDGEEGIFEDQDAMEGVEMTGTFRRSDGSRRSARLSGTPSPMEIDEEEYVGTGKGKSKKSPTGKWRKRRSS